MDGGHMVMYRYIRGSSRITKYITSYATLAADAAGNLFGTINSLNVTGASDFNSIGADYQSYRVKQIIVKFFPATTSATSGTGPYQSACVVSRWWGLAPSTIQGIVNDQYHASFSSLEEYVVESNWLGFKDAEEWSPYGTAILSTNQYGLTYGLLSNIANSTRVFVVTVTYVTEFVGEI